MSDFLYSTRERPPGSLRRVLERYLSPVTESCVEYHGPWGSLAVALASHDREVVLEEGGVISVLIGDPVVRTPSLPAGRARSAGRRRAVHHLIAAARVAWDEHLDGAFACLFIDGSRGATLVTDLAAFVIPYLAADADGGGFLLGTHLDAVAVAAGRGGDVDLVAAADLLANLAPTFPFTLYRGVRQVGPASTLRLGPDEPPGEPVAYWRPLETSAFADLDEASAELRRAVIDDVAATCGGESVVGLLLSGGEDARAVLGAVPEGVRVRAVTFADWENREVRVARRVAEAYGAEFSFGRRAPDHYLRGFPTVGALLGAGNMFIDVHGYGFHDALGLRDLPVVLGGLSSDSFLKAYHAPDPRRGGESFPVPRFPLVDPALLEEVAVRRTAYRRWLAQIRPESAGEWERIWPFSMRKHGGNLHGNRRLFASHEPYHANAVVKVAAGVPLRWKRDRALFHRAMRPLLRRSWNVPHAQLRYPFFGRYANLPLGAGLAVARALRSVVTGELRAKQGPWPKWRRVVASEEMRRRRAEYPVLEGPLAPLFTPGAPEELERSVSRMWHPLQQMLLLQLSYLTTLAGRGRE